MSGSISDPRVISRNEDAGITTFFHYDPHTEGFTSEDVQDAEPTIELNKLQMNEVSSGWKGDLHHVARIPLVIYENLRKAGILEDRKKFRAWLNDRDQRAFRTRPGNV